MGKLEKEIKVLNINKEEIINRLKKNNIEFVNVKNQKIFTYDLPSIYYRYLEIQELFNSSNKLILKTNLIKLMNVLEEYSDLVDDEVLNIVFQEMNINSFYDFNNLDIKDVKQKLKKSKTFNSTIKLLNINPNKWIRLRQSNDNIELTLKHVFEKNNLKVQKVKEIELNVSSLKDMNEFLESIGIVKRNYQEKIRTSYRYKDADIEIDQWPYLETYLEIECANSDTIDELLDMLKLRDYEIVSLNTQELYRRKNINILEIDELKF